MKDKTKAEESKVSATFRVGAIALVFLIIGYQVALFVYKASVSAVVAHRDRPDTVYVVDRALAEELLRGSAPVFPGDGPVASDAVQVASDAGPVILSASEGSPSPSPDVVLRRPARHSATAEAIRQQTAPRRYESFPFNPNTATLDDFRRLGFSEKQAQALLNYREKGGRFRRKEDFARSFVVADSVYERLEPFIRIPKVDLNTADSAAFDALPGIGPFYAARMVSYRRELGGYSYPEQLMDIWKFDREKYEGLSDLITVLKPYRYPLWTLPEDSLKLHPYIRSHAAHGIVLFRQASPVSDWTVDRLVAAGILDPGQGAKLDRCAEKAPVPEK